MNLERTVIALGFFDGVHRGHGALLQKTVQRAGELGAIPAVFTFDRPQDGSGRRPDRRPAVSPSLSAL